ncbi:FtsJ-like methyltransferase [Tetraselmis virus 1]|uniref:FtsJ-like methyltransferase n=1 Tax=Tetraselmis virus 1 TaxID=2060617 RepID=A0A2P0VP43_9VIRU|nr:FtsJ-like methyltransferase [Tetraselmis virus 1]AUF82688.1 FtsJ-like methyltransferase [Tetraselmis virus 1]
MFEPIDKECTRDLCDTCELKKTVELLKTRIGRYLSEWDAYKVNHNAYERVYTAPPAVMNHDGSFKHPASRAFYKLWEICHEVSELNIIVTRERRIKVGYLAEGPGSFIEAMVEMRRRNFPNAKDIHEGISLCSKNRTVPHWKLNNYWCEKNNVKIDHKYGNGDICNDIVRHNFVKEVGKGSCDIVTGDGGFDFSSDFNAQEKMMQKLLSNECELMINLLKNGGTAILKVFDAFDKNTLCVLGCFCECFSRFQIIKPKTSRPANSERYLICIDYNPTNESVLKLKEIIDRINREDPNIKLQESEEEKFISELNRSYSLKQVSHILHIMDHIDRRDTSICKDLSKEWMEKYNLHK